MDRIVYRTETGVRNHDAIVADIVAGRLRRVPPASPAHAEALANMATASRLRRDPVVITCTRCGIEREIGTGCGEPCA